MYLNKVLCILIYFPLIVHPCNYQLNDINGTIIFPPYDNNIECTWIFNLSTITNHRQFRSLLITFHHFDTEFGHDELLIGETIPDVSKYNSKLVRFSGSKLPDPCIIPLRGDIFIQPIWMQFVSDQTHTGSGFTLDYVFLVNQSRTTTSKSQKLLINADIRQVSNNKSKPFESTYPYPYGTISSPNYPQNYPDNIICRWHIYHRNAFIRLNIDKVQTELHYDTLTIYLGQNINNRAMILHEWSGDQIEKQHLFIPNDNLILIFTTDRTNNASGFSLHYEIIEKEIYTINLYENEGMIHSNNYPTFLRTNVEYIWTIHMNSSNEIEINLLDIYVDYDHDVLQVITGETIHTLNTPGSRRISTTNQTKLILRTKHSNDDYEYRGFNLTYRKFNSIIKTNNDLKNLPCGKTYSSHNGTIEFSSEIITALNCLMLIEVDDGQNIFLRFDYLNWDHGENYMEIGLLHNPDEYQLFHISDTSPGTWFIANDSQIWIRFYSSEFALNVCTFRLFYSETILWSTVTPKPYVQILDDDRLFPYQLTSLPTNGIYHNLTQAYSWHIEVLEDECVHIRFQSLQAMEDRRICFHVKDAFKTAHICSNEQFPFVYRHIGSCILSIEPEFIWMLVEYDVKIEIFKKVTMVHELNFKEDNITLTPPITSDSYIHIEWFISTNDSSMIIIDIENSDGNTPAELIIVSNINTTKRYSLGTLPSTRFSHVLHSPTPSFRILYTSLSLPIHDRKRLCRLNLHKISQSYYNIGDFHYISYRTNQSNLQWSIHGQYENSMFLANLISSNKNLVLQTTADVNLSITNSSIYIPSSNFNIRFDIQKYISNVDFTIILYEQHQHEVYRNILVNKTSDLIETNHFTVYDIQIHSTVFDSIDFVIIQADNGTFIRLYDLNVENNRDYFLLNLSSILINERSSLIGRRFSVNSLKIKIELQSLTRTPIQLRYQTRLTSPRNKHSHRCLITDRNVCKENHNNHSSTCHDSCSNMFDYISSSMNNTRINHFWPYALRGSVTLIIENTTSENFEKNIYRHLRHSIAKIIRQFCLKYEPTCLSREADSIRADHVIIQSYEEELDDHRLYVAVFIKDPYRQTIALTNDQFLLALKRYQEDIYQDIKYHIHLPSNILEHSALDPIWLYGICLMALFVLIIVLLILIVILVKKTFYSTNQNERIEKCESKEIPERNRLIISSPLQLAIEEDEQISSTCYNETDSSQTLNSIVTSNLLSQPLTTTTTYHHYPKGCTSYFNSTIETAIKQQLDNDDNEPIPFIDENLSTAHSRKSSACWSDRTSLSSRFSLIWRLNTLRSGSQHRSIVSMGNEKRRKNQHRTMRYTIPPSLQNQRNDEL